MIKIIKKEMINFYIILDINKNIYVIYIIII